MKDNLLRKEVLWVGAVVALLFGYLAFGDSAGSCTDDSIPLHAAAGHGSDAVPEGNQVTVTGVVTGEFLGRDRLGGFFLQSPDDADSAALFVYAPDLGPAERERVRPGAKVQVRGRTDLFHGRPQVGHVESVDHCGSPGLPEPMELTLPVDDDDRARLEGRLVVHPGRLTVIDNYRLGRHGTLTLAPERAFRGRSDEIPEAVITLDDGSYRAQPTPLPHVDENSGTRRVGDQIHAAKGILTHAFDQWRLHPLTEPRFESVNQRPAEPDAVGGDVRAAGFNVENYFLTLGERGASDKAELERQRDRLLPTLAALDADLVGLVELENTRASLVDLVERMNGHLDGPDYHPVSGDARGNDAIKVAFAYRPERLRLLEGPFRDMDPVHHRPPQAAVFQPRGGDPFLAVVVHFKAKVGCPEAGDVDRGQGCWNERRTAQAEALVEFARERAAEAEVDDILLLGDLNSYANEDPLQVLHDAGFADIIADRMPDERQYTYVFRGGSGTLDYAIANADMEARVSGVTVWHINADEPPVFGYDGRLADDSSAAGLPFRSSDHDPVLIGIDR